MDGNHINAMRGFGPNSIAACRRLSLLLFCAALVGLAAGGGRAAANPISTENVTARLVAERMNVVPGESVALLLHFEIREGWHTYWRNPGDSGQATRIDWQLPAGVTAGPLQWPTPRRLPYGPLVNHGYEGEALHLVEIHVPEDWAAGEPLTIGAEAHWLVCGKICIPEQARFELRLPGKAAGGLAEAERAALFAAARHALPVESPWPARFETGGERVTLSLAAPGLEAESFESAHFFPDTWGVIEAAAPQALTVGPKGLTLTMTAGAASAVDRLDGVLVLTGRSGDGSQTRAVTVNAAPAAPEAGGAEIHSQDMERNPS